MLPLKRVLNTNDQLNSACKWLQLEVEAEIEKM